MNLGFVDLTFYEVRCKMILRLLLYYFKSF